MSSVDKLIESFASNLQTLMRAQLSEEVNAALRGAFGSGSKKSPPRGATAVPVHKNGGRRSPEQIAKQAEKVLAYISKNPEQRAEQIAGALGLSTKDLVAPIKSLLAARKIKASGVARGTNYKAVG